MVTRHGKISRWLGCVCGVLLGLTTTVWGESDKTIVDIQRGDPEAPSRYHRPRAAQVYRYDKTELDLATPLPPQPPAEPQPSQRPATLSLPSSSPAPTPAPGGGR